MKWLRTASPKRRTRPTVRLQPISFFSIGKSGSTAAPCNSSRMFECAMTYSVQMTRDRLDRARRSACQRRRDAAKEQPRDQKSDPDDKSEQAEEIDGGKLAEALLPQRLEVRQDADREEGED